MSENPSAGRSPNPAMIPLRVERVDPGASKDVWITGITMHGIMTRFQNGRSVYVHPEDHETVVVGKPIVWKGFLSACVYDRNLKQWVPVCLEISERLELDLRGRWKRGQIWRLSRAKLEGKKKPPTRGALIETREDRDTPHPLDLRHKIEDIFRVKGMHLTTDNPLPDHVIVVPVNAPPAGQQAIPADPASRIDPALVAEQRKKLAELIGNRGKSDLVNGYAGHSSAADGR